MVNKKSLERRYNFNEKFLILFLFGIFIINLMGQVYAITGHGVMADAERVANTDSSWIRYDNGNNWGVCPDDTFIYNIKIDGGNRYFMCAEYKFSSTFKLVYEPPIIQSRDTICSGDKALIGLKYSTGEAKCAPIYMTSTGPGTTILYPAFRGGTGSVMVEGNDAVANELAVKSLAGATNFLTGKPICSEHAKYRCLGGDVKEYDSCGNAMSGVVEDCTGQYPTCESLGDYGARCKCTTTSCGTGFHCDAGNCVADCDDSDDSGNPPQNGEDSTKTRGTALGYTDSCQTASPPNLNVVVESYCSSTTTAAQRQVSCPNGYLCSNGACVILCKDSDSGNDPDNQGTTVNYTASNALSVSKTDTCIASGPNTGKLIEYYCTNPTTSRLISSEVVNCPSPKVCESGKCVAPSGSCVDSDSSTDTNKKLDVAGQSYIDISPLPITNYKFDQCVTKTGRDEIKEATCINGLPEYYTDQECPPYKSFCLDDVLGDKCVCENDADCDDTDSCTLNDRCVNPKRANAVCVSDPRTPAWGACTKTDSSCTPTACTGCAAKQKDTNGCASPRDCDEFAATGCSGGQSCNTDGICVSGPTCSDGIKNQGETEIDCGGTHCPACPPTNTCTDGDEDGYNKTGVGSDSVCGSTRDCDDDDLTKNPGIAGSCDPEDPDPTAVCSNAWEDWISNVVGNCLTINSPEATSIQESTKKYCCELAKKDNLDCIWKSGTKKCEVSEDINGVTCSTETESFACDGSTSTAELIYKISPVTGPVNCAEKYPGECDQITGECSKIVTCPHIVPLDFFSWINFVISIVVIAGIYTLIILRKR